MAEYSPDPADLKTTPLDALHRRLGGRMVPFAGYAMPVQYAGGIIAEHSQCRTQAALFDVSHMGQGALLGADAAKALEALVPGDIQGLKPGRQRYTLFTNERGGIIDDLMVANAGDKLVLVVNASRKAIDFAHLRAHMPAGVKVEEWPDRALMALQGPEAATVMARLSPAAAALSFMGAGAVDVAGLSCWVTRSGYTGEDGFEISCMAEDAERLAERLLAEPEVAPAGLGARDSLRLEAGLCLYGNDIDENTNPVEADLVWTIGKRRKMEWNFLGAHPIRETLENGPHQIRVGIRPEGRAPARAGTQITAADGTPAGIVTSGGFGPTLGAPVAMGYVMRPFAADGTALDLLVRGKPLPGRVAPLPFVAHRYAR
ncbi:MAG: glycine cleavage system aminomethyltransferase GcvT [Alphaproteobacteria bacterium]|nr:glycine cleavage system aminomethyltransferase GcvT [Alphaproteobacteria bacterium]